MNPSIDPVTDRLNRPMHDLRISVIDTCNFRCPYCMPAEVFGEDYAFLPKEQLLSFDEIVRLARIFSGFGVSKIKLTGGEPLMRPWMPELIARMRTIPSLEEIALITNGLLLEKMVGRLQDAGLSRLTVSLDSLNPTTFAEMNGRGHRLDQILAALDAAHSAGFAPIKLNVVVQRGINDHEVLDFVRRFRGTDYIVRFIEFMDVGNRNKWSMDQVVPSRELVDRIHTEFPMEPVEPNYQGEVATRYQFRDGMGEIGFISSVSQPFCGSCSRVRLSADGKLYTCLFARIGTDLRALLRNGSTDDAIAAKIRAVWTGRDDRYSELRAEQGPDVRPKIEMYHIGG